jgi:tetratricopeptide (TPR) repeat protein
MSCSSSDDDSDDGFGGMFSKLAQATLDIDSEEEGGAEENGAVGGKEVTYGSLLDEFLGQDEEALRESMRSSPSSGMRHASAMLLNLLHGEYLDVVASPRDHSNITIEALMEACGGTAPVDTISNVVISYVSGGPSDSERERRATVCLTMGVAFLSLYIQTNFTGPELPGHVLAPLQVANADAFHKHVLANLECDGEYTYADKHIVLPHCLLLARVILRTLAFPHQPNWVSLNGARRLDENSVMLMKSATSQLRCVHWSCARAAIFHLRALNVHSYEKLPSLWTEAEESFKLATASYGQDKGVGPDQVASRVWLEWGLAQHHFECAGKGKECFKKAMALARLECTLTGAMGKRTKYQRTDHAQLYVNVRSALAVGMVEEKTYDSKRIEEACLVDSEGNYINQEDKDMATKATVSVTEGEGVVEGAEGTEEEGKEEKNKAWEIGRRMVQTVGEEGHEAAAREVSLNEAAASIQDENILFENGPKFSEKRQDDQSDECHPLDQAIILSLCLDVSNSNPTDGLTTEEMFPYVRKVLDQPRNWMIHSTGLMERSWLEFEKRKTMDRALMQIQALLDQHTTRLTIFQSTEQSIQDSAPAQDRVKYATALVYPAQYELKRDLANKYMSCGVFDSALHLFREIELWDEVIKCYQLMSKPFRAEMVVREQLKVQGKTPYLICILGDLTQKVEYYEEAWVLSNGRFARAKRTWANKCFDEGDFEGCFRHMEDALEVQPFVTRGWYLKGVAGMALKRWDSALEAFHRALNQDDDLAEAWSNVGAIHLHNSAPEKALIALEEAMRRKRGCFKIQENILAASLQCCDFQRCIRCMNYLLMLHEKSKTKYYPHELRLLSGAVARQALVAAEPVKTEANKLAKDHTKEMDGFFKKALASVSVNATFWEVFSEYCTILGRTVDSADHRMKQMRGILGESRWVYDAARIDEFQSAALALVEACKTLCDTRDSGSGTDDVGGARSYAGASLLGTGIQAAKQAERDVPEVKALIQSLSGCKDELDTLYQAAKKQ